MRRWSSDAVCEGEGMDPSARLGGEVRVVWRAAVQEEWRLAPSQVRERAHRTAAGCMSETAVKSKALRRPGQREKLIAVEAGPPAHQNPIHHLCWKDAHGQQLCHQSFERRYSQKLDIRPFSTSCHMHEQPSPLSLIHWNNVHPE